MAGANDDVVLERPSSDCWHMQARGSRGVEPGIADLATRRIVRCCPSVRYLGHRDALDLNTLGNVDGNAMIGFAQIETLRVNEDLE